MPSKAISGVGVEFYRWNGATWDKISEILSLDGPNKKRDTIDVTNLDSTGGYREFISSFRDGGDVKIGMNFTRDGYEAMDDDFADNEKKTYEIRIPDHDNTTFSFLAVVSDLGFKVDTSKQITSDVTLKISGPIALDSGSGPAPA